MSAVLPLADRTYVVTGGASGIGRATAAWLLEAGASEEHVCVLLFSCVCADIRMESTRVPRGRMPSGS